MNHEALREVYTAMAPGDTSETNRQDTDESDDTD